MAETVTADIPEQGQLVRVRGRHYLVQSVSPYQARPNDPVIHHISLECLDDDRLGEPLEVIWEREVRPAVHGDIGLPAPEAWDPAPRFQAFLHAIQWSANSLLNGPAIQAPFRAAIDIEEYQLEPVARALVMPRVNLLIADDVGLGKTIEAGLVMQEMLARGRIRRAMIVCPASLQRQWREEMLTRFQLPFEIIDREAINRLRREYGMHVNPWSTFPRLITSMDFLKREQPLRLLHESFQQRDDSPLRDWDLLIVDEAHNAAPAGRKNYVRDSDRTVMLRAVIDHFEHRLFLTATPHNGYTESFTALLEILDPLRFSRGPEVDRKQVQAVMVRRLKDGILTSLGSRKFAKREVVPLWVDLTPDERAMHDLLRRYTNSRLGRVDWSSALTIRFALTLLKKRLLSSPLALANSLAVHTRTVEVAAGAAQAETPNAALAERLRQRAEEEWDDDEEKARAEEDALQESSRFFGDLTKAEHGWLTQLAQLAAGRQTQPDSKAQALLDWIREHLCPDGVWNRERLLIFTEYRDTLVYLKTIFEEQGWGNRVMTLVGGMPAGEQGVVPVAGGAARDRESIKAAFQASPDEHPVRILLATDAASEGLNLQNHCRYLIHVEIPWNPNRMEQRNGRIDRHGQRAPEVFCHHFVYRDHEDSQFLQTVVEKVQTMRADLGSVGEVIAAQVEQALLGRRSDLELPEDRRRRVQEEVQADLVTESRTRELAQQLTAARRQLLLYPDNLRLVLDEALCMAGHAGLEPVNAGPLAGRAWWLKALPAAWAECRDAIRDREGRLLMLVFDHAVVGDRRDVALVHLNHPLMRRSLAAFRAQAWTQGLTAGEPLHRVTYRVLPDYKLPEPVIAAYGRVVAVSDLGLRLHEALIHVGGQIRQRRLDPLADELLAGLLSEAGDFPPIPVGVAAQLRSFFPAHRQALLALLGKRQAQEETRLRRLLAERIKTETTGVAHLMTERIREIERRLAALEGAPTDQLALFDLEQYTQYQEDVAWLRRRLTHLRGQALTEPTRIERRYTLRSVRAFPLALIYLLPQSLVDQGGPSPAQG